MRQSDIKELLKEASENILSIEKQIVIARQNPDITEILKVKIKSTLEHQRSCLDYCAKDIFDIIVKFSLTYSDVQKYKNRIYFPYGKTYDDFYSSLSRNRFKKLPDLNRYVYELIESIQPYKANNDWLINLCNYSNTNKHNQLNSQDRKDSKIININGISAIKIDSKFKGKINLSNCTFNGKKIQKIYGNSKNISIITDTPDIPIQLINETEFAFEGTDINILVLVKTAQHEISNFQDKLYRLLTD